MTGFVPHLLHQALCGGVAAAGFGVLFNVGLTSLGWCFASGMLALTTRTLGLEAGWSQEAPSFSVAGIVTVCMAELLGRVLGIRANARTVAGCIPMVPGAFFAQALLGLFALTSPTAAPEATIVATVVSMLRVVFTLAGIGAGVAIPLRLLGRQY